MSFLTTTFAVQILSVDESIFYLFVLSMAGNGHTPGARLVAGLSTLPNVISSADSYILPDNFASDTVTPRIP